MVHSVVAVVGKNICSRYNTMMSLSLENLVFPVSVIVSRFLDIAGLRVVYATHCAHKIFPSLIYMCQKCIFIQVTPRQSPKKVDLGKRDVEIQ